MELQLKLNGKILNSAPLILFTFFSMEIWNGSPLVQLYWIFNGCVMNFFMAVYETTVETVKRHFKKKVSWKTRIGTNRTSKKGDRNSIEAHFLKILRCEIQLQMHDDEKFYFTIEGNERQQNSYYESLGHHTL
jgi:hypothetical protein